ncbi:MAG TPA: hypothetical protein GX710_06150 [Clostridiales bacterium]|nr:hypothetical protein [Clostridiales bacterium]
MKKIFNFKNCIIMGIYSNIMFILFIIICLFYYDLYGDSGIASTPFEITAFTIEALGFILMAISILGIILLVRQRMAMKVLMATYLVIEVVIMLMDFKFLSLGDWYDGYSSVLIISHAVFSAIVCLSYLSLNHKKLPFQIVVGVAACIMLAGMFCIVYNIRIYASVLTNSFAYLFLYVAMLIQLNLEVLEVDCYGDKANVVEYKSSFFD